MTSGMPVSAITEASVFFTVSRTFLWMNFSVLTGTVLGSQDTYKSKDPLLTRSLLWWVRGRAITLSAHGDYAWS